MPRLLSMVLMVLQTIRVSLGQLRVDWDKRKAEALTSVVPTMLKAGVSANVITLGQRPQSISASFLTRMSPSSMTICGG